MYSKLSIIAKIYLHKNKEKISYGKLLLIGDNWNIKIFVFHFMMLQEKKVMLKGLEVLSTSLFSSSQKGLLSSAKVQSRIGLMILCVCIYGYICTSVYNINFLSWSHQGRGKLEGTQNSLSLQNSKLKYLLCLRRNYESAELQLKLSWHWDTSQVSSINRQWFTKYDIQNNNWLILMLILNW